MKHFFILSLMTTLLSTNSFAMDIEKVLEENERRTLSQIANTSYTKLNLFNTDAHRNIVVVQNQKKLYGSWNSIKSRLDVVKCSPEEKKQLLLALCNIDAVEDYYSENVSYVVIHLPLLTQIPTRLIDTNQASKAVIEKQTSTGNTMDSTAPQDPTRLNTGDAVRMQTNLSLFNKTHPDNISITCNGATHPAGPIETDAFKIALLTSLYSLKNDNGKVSIDISSLQDVLTFLNTQNKGGTKQSLSVTRKKQTWQQKLFNPAIAAVALGGIGIGYVLAQHINK